MSHINNSNRVSLYVKGDLLDPNEVTLALGVVPSKAHRKGDTWLTKTKHKVVERTGLWSLTLIVDSDDLSAVLLDLIVQFAGTAEKLSKLNGIEEMYLDIFISIDADEDGGGTCEFDLSAECQRALIRFDVPIRFTIAVVPE